jgi:ABC-type lipoprotein release transport system permease subunit
MGAIVVGVVALVFYLGFTTGFINTYIESAIENELSHIQIHHPLYKAEKESQYYITNPDKVSSLLEKQSNIKAYTQRTIVDGIALSARGAKGLRIKAVIPEKEAIVTKIDQKITTGVYLSASTYKTPVIVSERLAEKLQLKVKSKLVVQFQDISGEIQLLSFKICGLYKTNNKQFDEQNIFVNQKNLQPSLGADKIIHEIALLTHDLKTLPDLQQNLQTIISDTNLYLVENYRQVSPDVNLYETQMGSSKWLIIIIVMLALIFGIINTMLMAVLERTREFGMLMAVGMKRNQVFLMILTETLLMALIATPIAMIAGAFLVGYFGTVGIQMAGLEQVGISQAIYPYVTVGSYFSVGIAVATTAFLAAIYPARKATKLKPVEAISHV